MPAATKSIPEAVVTWEWARPLSPRNDGRLDGTHGVLEINSQSYLVLIHRDAGAVTGYQLAKSDGTVYDVDAENWHCDCPDRTYRPWRPKGCKHSRALRDAIAELFAQT